MSFNNTKFIQYIPVRFQLVCWAHRWRFRLRSAERAPSPPLSRSLTGVSSQQIVLFIFRGYFGALPSGGANSTAFLPTSLSIACSRVDEVYPLPLLPSNYPSGQETTDHFGLFIGCIFLLLIPCLRVCPAGFPRAATRLLCVSYHTY